MTNLLLLNKLIKTIFFLLIIIFVPSLSIAAVDIWEKKEDNTLENTQTNSENKITIESPKLSDEKKEKKFTVSEEEINTSKESIIGIFDPEINDFNLNLWSQSNGEDIKKFLKELIN